MDRRRDDPAAIRWYQKRFGYELLNHEPTRHTLHRISGGRRSVWAIHRGLKEFDQLAHLRLRLA